MEGKWKPLMLWMSIPALLMISMFSYPAEKYEPWLLALVLIAALGFMERAVRAREYSLAVASVVVVVGFSPLLLVVKTFLIMVLVCIATGAALVTAFRSHPSLEAAPALSGRSA
jgi:hypothetical protein